MPQGEHNDGCANAGNCSHGSNLLDRKVLHVLQIKGGQLLRDTERNDREENNDQQPKEPGVYNRADGRASWLWLLQHCWTSGKGHDKRSGQEKSSGVAKDDG